MKEISIFIDESGDFGKLNPRSPYYIVTMVFHNQATDINSCLESLDQELSYLGYPHHCLHAGLSSAWKMNLKTKISFSAENSL